MRKFSFENGGHYHIYNRGVDKRLIVSDQEDSARFIKSLIEFNVHTAEGGFYKNSFKKEVTQKPRLVNLIAFCLNPNHFHLILEQVADKGVEKFMQKVGTGYTMYFNKKHQRTGTLFQGTYKAKLIDSNDYILHLSVYVNLNNHLHQLRGLTSQLVRNSWIEYTRKKSEFGGSICTKDIILGQFKNKEGYEKFALDLLPSLRENKDEHKELEDLK